MRPTRSPAPLGHWLWYKGLVQYLQPSEPTRGTPSEARGAEGGMGASAQFVIKDQRVLIVILAASASHFVAGRSLRR